MVAVSTHYDSTSALRLLNRSQSKLETTLNRLSSGKRLTQASDDPIDLSISKNLQSEIRSLNALKRTHFDGFNFVSLADGSLSEVTNVLERIAELAEQAASDTSGSDGSRSKAALDLEYQSLLGDIDQLNDQLRYNGLTVFGSTGATYVVNMTTEIDGPFEQITMTTSSFSTTALNLNATDINTSAGASLVLERALTAIEDLSRQRARLGIHAQRIEENMGVIDDKVISLEDQKMRISDADIAQETINLTKYQIMNQSNLAVISQANLSVENVFRLLS